MKDVIKKILREESEESTEEFIEKHKMLLGRIEKILPKLIEFLSNNLKDFKLYDIKVDDTSISYGSTWVYNKETNSRETYTGKSKIITLTFIKLTLSERQEVRKLVYDYVEGLFGIPIREYGTPLDLVFYNLTEKEF